MIWLALGGLLLSLIVYVLYGIAVESERAAADAAQIERYWKLRQEDAGERPEEEA